MLDELTVIVVTYNSRHCLESLCTDLKAFKHVSIVDNASEDGSADLALQLMPQAQVLRNACNLGFGAANNRALHRVATPYALLLNPDCRINLADCQKLLSTAQEFPDAAIVAPQLLDRQGAPETSHRWPRHIWASRGEGAQGPCCVGFVSGAAMLLRMTRFEGIGFFDEALFLYYEDDDLCSRLFQAKRAILFEPRAVCTHLSRSSVRGRSVWQAEHGRGFHHAQSKLTYCHKYMGTHHARSLRSVALAKAGLMLLVRCLSLHPKHIARAWGRVQGLYQWNHSSYIEQRAS